MAAEIPNLVKRNGIYYFRCRIPSILTNGRAREVKISLKTGNLTSDLLDVILKVTDCSRWVIAGAMPKLTTIRLSCPLSSKKSEDCRDMEKSSASPITESKAVTWWLTRKWNSPSSEAIITHQLPQRLSVQTQQHFWRWRHQFTASIRPDNLRQSMDAKHRRATEAICELNKHTLFRINKNNEKKNTSVPGTEQIGRRNSEVYTI